MLSDVPAAYRDDVLKAGLNALYGARCFLTEKLAVGQSFTVCLNAPFGARCFLTGICARVMRVDERVLMHLLALGAF